MGQSSVMPARRSAPLLLGVAVWVLQLLSLGARAQNVLNGEPAAPGAVIRSGLRDCGARGTVAGECRGSAALMGAACAAAAASLLVRLPCRHHHR